MCRAVAARERQRLADPQERTLEQLDELLEDKSARTMSIDWRPDSKSSGASIRRNENAWFAHG